MSSFSYFEELPNVIQARILSFTVDHMNDLARIRSLSKSLKEDIVPFITSFGDKQFIKCCPKYSGDWNNRNFLVELMDVCADYEDCLPRGGDTWKFHIFTHEEFTEYFQKFLFPGCTISSIFFLPKEEVCTNQDHFREVDVIQQAAKLCHNITDSMTVAEVNDLWESISCKEKVFEPIGCVHTKSQTYIENEDAQIFNVVLTLRVPKEDTFLRGGFDTWDDATQADFVGLKCVDSWFKDDVDKFEEIMWPQRVDAGQLFRGYLSKKRSNEETNFTWVDVRVPMKIVMIDEDIWENIHLQPFESSCPAFSGLWNKYQQKNVSEGVFIVDGIISNEFRNRMIQAIDHFKEQSVVDYHPNSRDIVRDLVHPALYGYVEDVSNTVGKPSDVLPYFSPDFDMENRQVDQCRVEGKDFWGRDYETSKYQWLPTYFDISTCGSCHICDYVNNIVPASSHRQLYEILEGLFERILPCIESVFSYVQEISPQIRRQGDSEVEYDDSAIEAIDEKYCSLRGQRLQVITKIVDYELKAGESYEGVWHVEGMSHEEIVCTAVYILEKHSTLQGGDIEYKRAFHEKEATYIFSNVTQTRHAEVEDIIANGLLPLGKVEGLNGRLIVFPNSHVHRVTNLRNISTESGAQSKRRIIVFFLVNPMKRILSTREIPPQQKEAGGSMTREQAMEFRLELMRERKFKKQDWNVRTIELCEH